MKLWLYPLKILRIIRKEYSEVTVQEVPNCAEGQIKSLIQCVIVPRALHRHPSPLFLSFSASFSRLLIPTSNTYMTLGKSLCLSEALIPHLKMAVIIAGWLTSQSLRDDSIEIING